MTDTEHQRGGFVEAVAAARDDALVELGKNAAARRQRAEAASHPRSGGVIAAALTAGAVIAAGAMVYKARKARNGKPEAKADGEPNGHPVVAKVAVSGRKRPAAAAKKRCARRNRDRPARGCGTRGPRSGAPSASRSRSVRSRSRRLLEEHPGRRSPTGGVALGRKKSSGGPDGPPVCRSDFTHCVSRISRTFCVSRFGVNGFWRKARLGSRTP
jgi:hypothetical protein